MSDASAFVEEAAQWARELVRAEMRGASDYGQAMRRVARRIRVPFGAIYSLHYRTPKSIGAEIYYALGDAFDDQRRRYQEERKETIATTALGRALLRAADFMASEKDGSLDP